MQQLTTSKQDNQSTDSRLFQHSLRPEWGLAVLAWQRKDKRGFQFEDGKLRIIKHGYFDLLRTVDRPHEETRSTLIKLSTMVGRRLAAQREGSMEPQVSLDGQIAFFKMKYPKGFQGAKWAKSHRGLDAKTRLKRHRAPAVVAVRELVTAERIGLALRDENAVLLIVEIVALLSETDLVTKTQLRAFSRVCEATAQKMLTALHSLLWGDDGETAARQFDRWVGAVRRAGGKTVGWQLATALPALLSPSKFTGVKLTTVKRQAAWMAPSLVIDSSPRGGTYLRLCEMTGEIRNKLEESGLMPRDLLDVYDFIQLTMRPKTMAQIAESEASKRESATNAATKPVAQNENEPVIAPENDTARQ